MVVRHCVDAGNMTQVLCKNRKYYLIAEASLQPQAFTGSISGGYLTDKKLGGLLFQIFNVCFLTSSMSSYFIGMTFMKCVQNLQLIVIF